MSKEVPTTRETGLGKVRKDERKQIVCEVALTITIGQELWKYDGSEAKATYRCKSSKSIDPSALC